MPFFTWCHWEPTAVLDFSPLLPPLSSISSSTVSIDSTNWLTIDQLPKSFVITKSKIQKELQDYMCQGKVSGFFGTLVPNLNFFFSPIFNMSGSDGSVCLDNNNSPSRRHRFHGPSIQSICPLSYDKWELSHLKSSKKSSESPHLLEMSCPPRLPLLME